MKKLYVQAFLIFSIFLTPLSFLTTPLHAQEQLFLEDDLDLENDWDNGEPKDPIYDPWENMNRKFFKLNDKLFHLFTPISKGYDFLVPKKVQKSINNVFVNIKTPVRLFSCLFQGKLKGASTEFGRLLINSSVGLGGFFDPADAVFNLEVQDEDFGQTFAVWGMGEGRFLMLPLFGPATTREVLGFIGDAAFSPFTWFGIFDVESEKAFAVMRPVRRVNNFSFHVRDAYETFTEDAIDPYIALQHAFVQARRKKIKD